MTDGQTPQQRALTLAAVSGLKTVMGPALFAMARRREGWKLLAAAAVGEMLLDKLPFLPSRRSLPLLIPRALAGYWVANETLKEEGIDDPQGAAMGAAVAAGVATFAPMVRTLLSRGLSIPDALVAAAEDALALKLGGEAVGMDYQQIADSAREALAGLTDEARPLVDDLRERLHLTGQSQTA